MSPPPPDPTALYSIHNIACSVDYSAACLTYRKWDSRHGRVGQRPEKHHLGRRDGEGGVEGAEGKGGEWTWAMPQGDCYLSLVYTLCTLRLYKEGSRMEGTLNVDCFNIHCKCLQTNDRWTNVYKCYFYTKMIQKIKYSRMCYQHIKYSDY